MSAEQTTTNNTTPLAAAIGHVLDIAGAAKGPCMILSRALTVPLLRVSQAFQEHVGGALPTNFGALVLETVRARGVYPAVVCAGMSDVIETVLSLADQAAAPAASA